jgi:hypothetical protein
MAFDKFFVKVVLESILFFSFNRHPQYFSVIIQFLDLLLTKSQVYFDKIFGYLDTPIAILRFL